MQQICISFFMIKFHNYVLSFKMQPSIIQSQRSRQRSCLQSKVIARDKLSLVYKSNELSFK